MDCLDTGAPARRSASLAGMVLLDGRLMGYALLLKGYSLIDMHNSDSLMPFSVVIRMMAFAFRAWPSFPGHQR